VYELQEDYRRALEKFPEWKFRPTSTFRKLCTRRFCITTFFRASSQHRRREWNVRV